MASTQHVISLGLSRRLADFLVEEKLLTAGHLQEALDAQKKGGEKLLMDKNGRLNWSGIDPEWKDALDFRGRNDVESAGEEWTTVECRCEGGRIEVRVNGVQVNEVGDCFPQAGRILLQCEGSEIFFRKVELHPLR